MEDYIVILNPGLDSLETAGMGRGLDVESENLELNHGYAIYEKIKYKFKLSVFKMILEAQQKYLLLKTKIYYINH